MFNHTTIDVIDCVLAYDLTDKKYLFISPTLQQITGLSARELYQDHHLLNSLIFPESLAATQTQINGLQVNDTIELSYCITTPQKLVKNITDKKKLITDDASGHLILLSTLTETTGNDCAGASAASEPAAHSRQFLNSLLDSQTSFLIRMDPQGHYTFVNQQFLKVLGYKPKDIIGKHFSVTTIPNEIHLCQEAFDRCISNPGQVVHLLHKKPDVHGILHDTQWELITILNDKGEVYEIQGMGYDVTQKLKTEAEASAAAKKLDNFIESITDSFFIIDNDWKFVRVNAAFEKIWKKKRAQLLGQNILEAFPDIKDTEFDKAFQEAGTKQKSVKLLIHYKPLNKWLRTAVYPSVEGLTVFAKNVTYEMRAQDDIMWAQNNLEALINNTHDKIWSVDTESRYVYMNNAYIQEITAMTGIAPQKGEFTHKNMGFSQEVIEEWETYYKRALNGENYTILFENANPKAKETIFYEISFNPIYTAQGDIKGVGCFAHDITPRLKTEQELLKQNVRLRNIAILSSHELRRPVASLLGLLNIMDKENPNNPENSQIIDYLHIVSNEIDEVIRLIVDHTFTGHEK